jgi:hypothetical protein
MTTRVHNYVAVGVLCDFLAFLGYEAHVRKADGTQLEVLVNESFEVTATNTMRHP